jgi:hypothetical protein
LGPRQLWLLGVPPAGGGSHLLSSPTKIISARGCDFLSRHVGQVLLLLMLLPAAYVLFLLRMRNM